ncbi:carbohydrate ABC transporter permease [Amnibacterium kyonggiense]|uniref:Multiple sugar transport system permease protein n=1 Tax=Amnibacterium kyonggiense TaxID=595671 RepID=A0A4R7FS11_9MICO|nr:sugar ABC transporter permease [Amnibacterium kyonggiense]TDS80635.1 multiple sugar transport system permease protein [Amnibacterium kyonggiense]
MTTFAPGRKASSSRRHPRRGEELTFWIFLAPFFVGLLIFTLLPIAWSAVLSLFDAQATVYPTIFVGLRNYIDIVTDPDFLNSIGTFLVFTVFIVPVTLVCSLGLALLVNRLPHGAGFFRTVIFLPTACSYVVASLIWKLGLFNGLESSLANQVLALFGQQPIYSWLNQFPLFWILLVTVRLWLQIGFYMLLFSAALQRVPEQLYEAASIDGVRSSWRMFWSITWPQLRSTTSAVILLLMIAAFQAFDEFYNLVGAGPTARPPLVYLYNRAFTQQDFGHGSAGALVLTLIMVVVALLQNRFFGFGAADDDSPRKRASRKKVAA